MDCFSVSAGRIKIALSCVGALIEACRIKLWKRLEGLNLPPVAEKKILDSSDMAFLLRCDDTIIRLIGRWTGRKCFFRSYILAHVMRRSGMDAELNVGMRNLGARPGIR